MTSPPTPPRVTLNNEVTMPGLALGLFGVPDAEVSDTVSHALAAGYRSFDTAPMYRNEQTLGLVLNRCGLDRHELFVTTKIDNADQGYDSTLDAFDRSFARLDMGYIDMCLIHWPMPQRGTYVKTWRALEQLYYTGRVRAIGVCNFLPAHLLRLAQVSAITPTVNQIELHPLLTQPRMLDLHRSMDIHTQAWAPLARGRIHNIPRLHVLAARHGVSVAQIVLRWHLQRGTTPVVESSSPQRIRSDADVFDFHLSAEEMDTVSALNRDERTGPHPDTLA
jgi:diketogulonate reductase-like aldo/keto reductase